jgi:hypothetical protein
MEMKKQDMNLLLSYKAEQKRKANKISPIRLYTIILIATVLIVGALSLKLVLDNTSIKNEITEIQTYISSPAVIEKMDELSKINENLALLEDIKIEALSLNTVMDYKPRFDSKVLDIVYYEKPTTLKFTEINYSENEVSLDFTAKYVSDVSNYALHLQRTYSFADVSYDGYTYDEDTGIYTGTVICLLKGGN